MGSGLPDNKTCVSDNQYRAKWPYIDLYRQAAGFDKSKPTWSVPGNGTREGSQAYRWNYDVCSWGTCDGQALYETMRLQSVTYNGQTWGSTNSTFVTGTGNYSWSGRGDNGAFTGLFYSGFGGYGLGSPGHGFRAVLWSGSAQ